MKRWLIRIGIALLFLVALGTLVALFVYHNGIAYTVATLNDGWPQPYFDTSQHPRATCTQPGPCTTGPLRVLSYNIYNGSALLERLADLPDCPPWTERVPHLRTLLAGLNADLVGLQEMGGRPDMQALLPEAPGYTLVTYTFDDHHYSDSALLFRGERFQLLDSGQFWLSPTPELPFGFGWQRLSVWRYVNWAYLEERNSGFRFLFANTHFDNNGPNKEAAARVVSDVFGAYAEAVPIIFTGDFNTPPTTERYQHLTGAAQGDVWLHNTHDLAPAPVFALVGEGPIPERWPGQPGWDHMIDHIFVAGPVDAEVTLWRTALAFYDDPPQPLSDHPYVLAELQLTAR